MSTAPEALETLRPTVAEIDVDAFARNLAAIRSRLPARVRLIVVLKADAYGHGAVPLARRCEKEQVPMLAVALLEEAQEIRRSGVSLPILILGPLMPRQVELAAGAGFILGIVGPTQLQDVCTYSASSGNPVRIHLKLDSGMGRMGLVEADLESTAALLGSSPNVKVEALYTHFANASNSRDSFTQRQIERFERMRQRLQPAVGPAPLHHIANSAATVRGVIGESDFVRVGLSLYGGEPLDWEESRLEPIMTWRTRIARLKTLQAGEAVGYGTTFHTSRTSRIATLPVGYADGYDRLLSNCGFVLIRGRRAPVVGRVSMDLVTVDVTDIQDVAVGDDVILMGRWGKVEISAEEIAQKTGTISYEVFCNVSARVARLYRSSEGVELKTRWSVGGGR